MTPIAWSNAMSERHSPKVTPALILVACEPGAAYVCCLHCRTLYDAVFTAGRCPKCGGGAHG